MRLFLITLFLLPALVEIVYVKQLIVQIPGLPYSLGQFVFMMMGLAGLKDIRKIGLGQVGRAFFLIYLGMLLAALSNGNIRQDVNRSLGIIFLFITSIGWSRLLLKRTLQQWLDILMICMYIYWMTYTLSVIVSGGTIVSYSNAYTDDSAMNHHIPGINISFATFYLFHRFFTRENGLNLFGFILMGTSVALMLLLESRSNLLICLLMSLLSYIWIQKGKFSLLFRWAPVLLVLYFSISLMFEKFEFIGERFALDSDFQSQTTMSRRAAIIRFPLEIAQNPLGRGPNDYKLDFGDISINAHNNYITQIIIGGVIALIGVLMFWVKLIRMGVKGNWFRSYVSQEFPKQIYASYLASLTFFITLFTIELGHLLYYLSLSMMISTEVIFNKGYNSIANRR